MRLILAIMSCCFFVFPSIAIADSDLFPQSATPPVVGDFITTPSDTFYCAPPGSGGNNSTGDGSIGSPWVDFIGADGSVGPGDLIYFRGGNYPAYSRVNFSRSQNRLTDDGTEANPIVITNYPGEIVAYDSTDTTWCLTLGGDHQKLIGTYVSGDYGIQINGGISIHEADSVQVSNVEFTGGTSNGPGGNPGMVADPLNGYDNSGILISHNYFHDAVVNVDGDRIGAVRLMNTTGWIIEYNLFEDNMAAAAYYGGVVFKDYTTDAIVRHNTFINVPSGVSYFIQSNDQGHGDLEVYGNLFYGCNAATNFTNELCDSDHDVYVYDNVALALNHGFLFYVNADNAEWDNHGQYFDNVIDGPAIYLGSWAGSNNDENAPDYWDHNLYYAASDTNTPSGWSLPSAYYNNAVISADAVTWYSGTYQAAVVGDEADYDGYNAGKDGGNIGGFTWTAGGTITAPTNLQATSGGS